MLLERCPQLRARGLRLLVLRDPRPHPHHVREGPISHALAVGETAAAVPPDLLDDPVEVLVELPAEARLADTRDPSDGDEVRAALLRTGVEQVLDQLQLPVPAHE